MNNKKRNKCNNCRVKYPELTPEDIRKTLCKYCYRGSNFNKINDSDLEILTKPDEDQWDLTKLRKIA